MEKGKKILRDLKKALLAGLVSALLAAVLCFAAGALTGGGTAAGSAAGEIAAGETAAAEAVPDDSGGAPVGETRLETAAGSRLLAGVEAAKNGTLVLAALGMFLIAGMLLAKGKKPEKFSGKEGWRQQFSVLGYQSVTAAICLVFLAVAAALDLLGMWLASLS